MAKRRKSKGGKKKDVRVKVILACSVCKNRNYSTIKNKRNTTEKLRLNKYCPFDRKHTEHVQTK